MIETIAIAESNVELSPGYRLLTLDLNQDVEIQAGQFAMLRPRASCEPLLRRALAVYRVHSPRRICFLYQVLGRGTEALAQLTKGNEVEALLPLGNSWPTPAQGGRRAIVVAGGIGSASVFMLCEQLASDRVNAKVFFGAANQSAAIGCGLDDFRRLRLPIILTTDDGSLGERGLVTVPLERELRGGAAGATIFACGPWGMMKRVAEIATQFDARCLVSLEAPMACGFGVCVGCVVAVRSGGLLGYHSYKRVCTDGSIFPAELIEWQVNAMTH